MIKLESNKVEEVKGLLKQVKVAAVCRSLFKKGRISSPRPATVWEVLRGESDNLDTLNEVVKEARRIVAKKKKQLEKL